ncbi:hypothetical protein ACOMHN_031085 [Nucella lapillus]
MPHQRNRCNSLASTRLWLAIILLLWNRRMEAAASFEPKTSATFRSLPVDNVQITEDLLWESPARSRVDCGVQCSAQHHCLTFTFTPVPGQTQGRCRIHRRRYTAAPSKDQQVSTPGTREFSLVVKEWIRTTCSTGSHCTEPMSTCVSGRCLCSNGTFFDQSLNACVQSCGRGLGTTYLEYSNRHLFGHEQYRSALNSTTTTCRARCSADPRCVLFIYLLRKRRCFYKYSTAQDFPSSWRVDTTVITYQRDCA